MTDTAFTSSNSYSAGQPATVDFIENRLPDYHSAFQNPPKFDPVARCYLPPDIVSMTQPASRDGSLLWGEIFPDAMMLFQSRSDEPAAIKKSRFRIRNQQYWSGVEAQLHTAQDSYILATGGFKSWMRRARRHVADNSQTAIQATRLTPNVDMTAPVVNVIQSLLEAVQNAAGVRQEILSEINKLGETFDRISFAFELFPQAPNVREACVDLVATILDNVEKIIVFYNKRLPRKMLAAHFKGDGYEHSILQGIQNIKESCICLDRAKQDAHSDLSRLEARTQIRIGRETLEISRVVGAQTLNIQNSLEEFRDGLSTFRSLYHLLSEAENSKIQALRQRNAELEQTLRATTPTPSPGPSPTPDQVATTVWAIAPGFLWILLRVPEEIEKIDMQKIESRQESFPWADRGRSGQVASLQRFQTWIISSQHATLLLQSKFTNLGGMTALSMFCSILTNALRQKNNFMAVTFFCGMHESETDQYRGGQAMLRSFSAQLLCQQSFDTTGIYNHVDMAGVERGELAGLCQLFEWLVCQLPKETTLICIIDNLGLYEREAVLQELLIVVQLISRLMQTADMGATIKVMATSTTTVRQLRQFFPSSSTIDLSAVSDFDGPSRRTLRRQLNNDLDS